jgi:hypothetical protein
VSIHKTSAATMFATVALIFAVGGTASSAQPVAQACTQDTPAIIGGRHKCLGVGEYCAARYERQYVRYGFECVCSPSRLRRRR